MSTVLRHHSFLRDRVGARSRFVQYRKTVTHHNILHTFHNQTRQTLNVSGTAETATTRLTQNVSGAADTATTRDTMYVSGIAEAVTTRDTMNVSGIAEALTTR